MQKLEIKQRPLLTRPENLPGVPAFVAEILARRGVESEQELELKLKHLLAPTMKGLPEAIQLMDQAIDHGQKIVIVGDYDADGATSTALMVLALRDMGANVEYLVPDRFKYGYGLTPAIADLAFVNFTPDLLLTVDNGISSHDGVKQAQDHGMQVIITDHHLTTKPTPKAEAVVNPNQLGCDFPSKALAGVGVAFYVLANLSTHRKKLGKSCTVITNYLDLVALGTYADVASLDYNNRILVDAGLKRIQQGQCRAGISALLDIAKRDPAGLKAQDLGFVLGPRINAAGRMETMDIGIECLLAPDLAMAYPLAEQLNQLNVERRQVEGKIKQDALNELEKIQLDATALPAALIMFEPHWHQGVIGIVAGRLKEQFHRPSIVFAADQDGIHIKGSARSIEGIHIRDAIEQVAEQYPHLVSHFGGHAAAAGLTLKKENFAEFKQVFEVLIGAMDEDLFTATLWTDGELPASAFHIETVDLLQNLSPWGQKFPQPIFDGVFKIMDYRWLKDVHLKLRVALENGQVVDAIAFNAADKYDFDPMKDTRLVYELDKNVFNGNISLQMRIIHLEQ
ncbi:single-stranded-DNA-specific exonuclease RecJ [Acinetobacter lwoffii]|uniref:Single-stranded-DNA-specific exonuclease RecJ n=1 Tax=Acinetobacter lwoffii NCTC 5866 = CIP 64.10 = NIPH 512 TaxID=981327 RepID=A0ABP2ZAE9_ACILW|nr:MULTISPECIES: single-stranded-DNA-specific exonuclease RecJ [Acinetobacter]ODN53826.1 single-stranded-DNA-specific exonuclease RecJ [Acinetobacter sp. 51m]ENU15451.1 single-stranded-DNA-specific exonuclease RecJ [Acinetobacter sp. CIP A162]ENW26908.1 single-stranded-DNA-specific exonuclease RecJ [Acinetobacter lwoffii ATCC 9957 = CIP 70.31]ESJ94346.1 single-stranded-DNA-specific exonuclease RecJ [Acinetobacter lwoffii NCTC 5866 = CIP 64.10 = NIPH 512]MCU4438542.1 single-stranded-DNA-specifi